MDSLTRAIGKAGDLEELFPLMVMLSRRTEDMLSRHQVTEDDIQRIAHPLATIRLLLAELALLRDGPPGDKITPVLSVRDLADRFLDLEGRLKELRNDLARTGKAFPP